MWDNIKVIVLGLFIASLLVPFMGVPVYAEEPPKISIGDRIILDNGEYAVYLGKVDGKHKFMTTIDAPTYIPGTTTEIKPNWYYNPTSLEWVSGDNLFDATVKNEKVTVLKDGQKMSWEPTILVGTKDTKALVKEAILLSQDPINPNYWGNTLEWDYGVAKRHLRVIEGVLLELFIFPVNPGVDVQIKSNLYKDVNFVWDRPPFAYDANGEPIEISSNKIVKASEFNRTDITYPITIDPTSTFTTSASDGYAYEFSDTEPWSNIWDFVHGATGTGSSPSSTSLYTGIYGAYYVASGQYDCFLRRSFVYFNTAGLPDNANIDSSILKLYGTSAPESAWGAWNLIIQEGMPTYPSDPLVTSDYLYSRYAGNGGTLASSSMGSGYKEISLSAQGLTWINLSGTTKFALKEKEHDADDVQPSAPTTDSYNNKWSVYAYEQGTGYWPQLVVTYSSSVAPTVTTQAASDISTTTSKLHAYLNDDGGAASQIRWEYDTDSGVPYAYNTTWAGNYTTGQSANEVVAGLTINTLYYFRAQAKNDTGTSSGSELTFTTLSSLNPPTNFVAIPRSNSEISLKWTKGVGSSQTLVMYKVGEYPGAAGDGTATVATNTTQGSYLLEDLGTGVTYYFKAWGYDGGSFSATNTTEIATTLAGRTPLPPAIDAPTQPSRFWEPPSLEKVVNMPGYDLMNRAADSAEMPRTTFWLIFAMGISMVLGAVFYIMTKDPIFALIGVGLGMMGGWEAWIIPWWILMIYVLLAGAIMFTLLRRGAA